MVPLCGVFEGDFVAQLFVVETTDTMPQVAEKMARHAVDLRVAPETLTMGVYKDGKRLPDQLTVEEAGIQPMDVIIVGYVRGAA